MKNFIQKIIVKRHRLIVEENDMTELLTIFNSHTSNVVKQKQVIGNCGWKDYKTKWFMFISVSNANWNDIEDELVSKGFVMEIKEDGYTYLTKEKKNIFKRFKKVVGF